MNEHTASFALRVRKTNVSVVECVRRLCLQCHPQCGISGKSTRINAVCAEVVCKACPFGGFGVD